MCSLCPPKSPGADVSAANWRQSVEDRWLALQDDCSVAGYPYLMMLDAHKAVANERWRIKKPVALPRHAAGILAWRRGDSTESGPA